ncbi:hypothetical protein [Cognatazoarcus halotolerans]|uniref:hypothetical protein n=1 Tax=Cognatazoarcus halotolerans TaxID=2686016 RepID=UPI00135763C0|nr:hypothetical protein [Cognatazoarcus halotolerans]MCB1901244.1 hypothetical protein [Rhodocyclaceae bacterium]MCP5307931.1 hypothetical protein [Zoogloeaceae bacterium]
MLSITDLLDFIDLDVETVRAVSHATGLAAEESAVLAQQLLSSAQGLSVLHHMFLDQIADAEANFHWSREKEMRRAYAYFSRKYPLPGVSRIDSGARGE